MTTFHSIRKEFGSELMTIFFLKYRVSQKKVSLRKNINNSVVFGSFLLSKGSFEKFRF